MLDQEIRKKIGKKCISLEKYCVWGLAWTKYDAINLINDIMEDKIGILGGDVCRLEFDCFEYLYAYWWCEPKESESSEEHYPTSEVEDFKFNKKHIIQVGPKIKFSSETQEEYYRRSKQESLKYIEGYPVEHDENIVFKLVFTDYVFLSTDETIYGLAKPDYEVKETSVIIADNWLMCSLCQEVWEDTLNCAMVRCPKCNKKLHNPKFNK